VAGGLLGDLLDLIYPRVCVLCGSSDPEKVGAALCTDCTDRWRPIRDPVCRHCGRPLGTAAEPELVCRECAAEDTPLDHCRAVFEYGREEGLREAILAFKHQGLTMLARDFAPLLARVLERGFPDCAWELLVPVPIHWRREGRRGYNQSELLARRLVLVRPGMSLETRALVRTRATRPQHGSRASRRANVRNAFAVPRPERVAGRRVLLIDDVLTTGATLQECARTLRAAGATHVDAIALARVVWKD
jgi:ComF family protein